MANKLSFFVNQSAVDSSSALCASFTNALAAPAMIFSPLDTARPVVLCLMHEDPTASNPALPFIADDPTGLSATIGAGLLNQPVTGGTFLFTDVAATQTSGTIAYNASAVTVQAAIRAACTTNFASCVVTGNAGGPWTVDRGSNGAFTTAITGDTSEITPPSSVLSVESARVGTTGASAQWEITLVQPAAVVCTLTGSTLPAAAVSVAATVTGSAGVNAVQTVTWNSDAYAGSVSLVLTLPTARITTASLASPSVVTTSASHNLQVGDSIVIAGNTQTSLNGTQTVSSVPSATTFTTSVNLSTAGTGGTVALTRGVGPLAYNIAPTDFVSALSRHGATTAIPANFAVAQNASGVYAITFTAGLASTAIATMTATQALSVPIGMSGTMDCNTVSVNNLLIGATGDVGVRLEIKLTDGSGDTSAVAVRTDAVIRPTLFAPSVIGSNPLFGNPTIESLTVLNPIGSTSTDGIVIEGISATSDVGSEWSPRLRFVGSTWNGDDSSADTDQFYLEVQSGVPAAFVLSSITGSGIGGSPQTLISIDTGGEATLTGDLFVSGGVTATILSCSGQAELGGDVVVTGDLTVGGIPISQLTNLTVTGINAKTTGSTAAGTTMDGSLRFFPAFVLVECTAASSVTGVCSISVGSNSGSWNNIIPITSQTGVNAANIFLVTNVAGAISSIPPNTPIDVDITTGATATSQTISVSVYGYYAP